MKGFLISVVSETHNVLRRRRGVRRGAWVRLRLLPETEPFRAVLQLPQCPDGGGGGRSGGAHRPVTQLPRPAAEQLHEGDGELQEHRHEEGGLPPLPPGKLINSSDVDPD